ncbi:type I-E CRISPR-associated protein Cse2/CasB [Brachybacterium vulturis]|uniref:Type I-E CRISPR-associated protein Cse2/CasB n=1 Tax=Brachybacterium vulturis TaxID=2017484 RepID=A0A291GKH3_9MICO|nr:type I-E CRISPR-associated protein Cse2/CasB [Brachybacterium vulturis]ATG50697.1 type I-E CRISPR-associated protein Cse2/CasB [Brachybacterium vulturis]
MNDHSAPEPQAAPATPVTLQHAVGSSAATLQSQYLGERGVSQQTMARGRLAVLRRSAGFTALQHPLTMQEVLDSLDPGLALDDLGSQDAPSPSESAAFDAMTLFALHMQSAAAPAHVRRRSFGTAMGMLRLRSDSGSLKPRFDALLSARHERSRLTHARSLITLLRSDGIGLDYGLLARDLRTLSGRYRSGVLLRWARDFATTPRRETADAPETVATSTA